MLSTRWFTLYVAKLAQNCAMLNTSALSFVEWPCYRKR